MEEAAGVEFIKHSVQDQIAWTPKLKVAARLKGQCHGGKCPLECPVKTQRLKVAARTKGLDRHLYSKLGVVFQTFVRVFKLQVAKVDEFGLGVIIMGDENRTEFLKNVMGACRLNPNLRADILEAHDIATNLKVSPQAADPTFAQDFLRAVEGMCSGLCLHILAEQLRSE